MGIDQNWIAFLITADVMAFLLLWALRTVLMPEEKEL
ncbi:hypothetical protein NIES970_21480 [[Synechococcus] sp. NIES-970]|nr:hypothetical protein NIES970_21480 [[Synechococcus] sp. NIES-970]